MEERLGAEEGEMKGFEGEEEGLEGEEEGLEGGEEVKSGVSCLLAAGSFQAPSRMMLTTLLLP